MFIVVGLVVALLAPALALAVEQSPPDPAAAPPQLTPSNVRPDAELTVTVDDTTVTFDASRSSDPDGALAAFEWDLDGDSVYETTSGTQPVVERELSGGTTLVAAVRVHDDDGAADEATAAVAVPLTQADAPVTDQKLVEPDELPTAAEPSPQVPAAEPASEAAREQRAKRSRPRKREPTVRAAAGQSVAIRDFEFRPGTVNVNVGDTVTWTNRDSAVHTATADKGSFDSGNLSRGESYSKTFTSAGTYSYFCKPHPYMRGRVVVAGAGGDGPRSGGSGSGGDSSGAAAGAGSDGSGGTTESGGSGGGGLANTGVDLVAWAVFGFALLAFGGAMRLRLAVD